MYLLTIMEAKHAPRHAGDESEKCENHRVYCHPSLSSPSLSNAITSSRQRYSHL